MGLEKRNGVWYFRATIGGTRHRVSTEYRVESKATKALAQRRASEIELEIRAGRRGWKKDVPTVTRYWTTVYEPTYTRRKRRGQLDRQIMAHALPVFGSMALDAVTTSHCEAYLNVRRQATAANPKRKTPKQIAEGTVQRERSFLRAFFQRAVIDGLIDRNPWAPIKSVAYDVRERLLTEDEQRKLLAKLSAQYQRFVLFLLGTGVRLEECRGIVPARDLDLERRGVVVTGKFSKVRRVPLPAVLVPILETQIASGRWWTQNPQRLREVLRKAAKAAGIGHLSPHALRHTFGWRWLKGGGDIYTLSKVLGHANLATTQRHYAHVLPEDIQAKADRVDLGLGLKAPAKVLTMERA